jgi:hypothetical protein
MSTVLLMASTLSGRGRTSALATISRLVFSPATRRDKNCPGPLKEEAERSVSELSSDADMDSVSNSVAGDTTYI